MANPGEPLPKQEIEQQKTLAEIDYLRAQTSILSRRFYVKTGFWIGLAGVLIALWGTLGQRALAKVELRQQEIALKEQIAEAEASRSEAEAARVAAQLEVKKKEAALAELQERVGNISQELSALQQEKGRVGSQLMQARSELERVEAALVDARREATERESYLKTLELASSELESVLRESVSNSPLRIREEAASALERAAETRRDRPPSTTLFCGASVTTTCGSCSSDTVCCVTC